MPQAQSAARETGFENAGELTPSIVAESALEAAVRLQGFVEETPVHESALGTGDSRVVVKDETQHPGGSFKDRGAGNAVIYHAGTGIEFVATSSAGNHGLGVARAASEQGASSLVVLPSSASDERKEAVSRAGAEVIIHGQNFDAALEFGLTVAEERDGRFVHPFSDPLVIAGQATIGLELLRQRPDMTHVVLPVGGGGMLAGVASVIKEYREGVQVIAAQVPRNTAYVDSLTVGLPLQGRSVDTFYGGIAVGSVDPATFDIAKQVVDSTVVLDELETSKAIYDFRKEQGTILEPAGAVSLAAAGKIARLAAGKEVEIVAIASGANNPQHFGRWLDARARRYGWNAG